MTLLSWLIKASVIVVVAAIVQATLGTRMSAAMRHVTWALTMVALLLFPAFSFMLPAWKMVPVETQRVVVALSQRVAPATDAAIARPSRSVPEEPDSMFQWASALPAIYAVIAALMLARLALQRLSIQRLAGRATDVTDRGWMRLLAECAAIVGVRHSIRLLTSLEQVVPAMFGMRRPAILLPAGADEWPDDRRRAVLLHELGHVARYDCLWQTLASVACAIYWVHPGAWWIARRMRVERELAYRVPGHALPAVAIEMASRGQLERRLVALMDGTRQRAVPSRSTRLTAFALILLMVAPISSAAVGDGEFTQADDVEQVMGLWEIRPASAGFVEVRLCHADLFAHSEVPIRAVQGLSEEWLSGAARPIRLILQRDAGAFTLDGTVGRGRGSGTYAFVTEPRFPRDFESLGFRPPTAAMAGRYPGLGTWTHTLALYDLGFESLETLQKQEGPRLDWSEFVRIKQHQAHFEGLRQALAHAPARSSNWC